MKAKTLPQAWLEVGLEKKTLADMLRKLNKKLDMKVSHSRAREFEHNRNNRGKRLPRELRIYMGKEVIRQVLEDSGIDTKDIPRKDLNKIVERLS